MKLSSRAKSRLGVLWVLLNLSTEYSPSPECIGNVMDRITDAHPSAPLMWKEEIQILVNGRPVLNFKKGTTF